MPLVVLGDVVVRVFLEIAELAGLLDPRGHLGPPRPLKLLELRPEGDDALGRDRFVRWVVVHRLHPSRVTLGSGYSDS